MKLLGRANSINVRKVLWTCAELGLSPEREDWGEGARTISDPEFLAVNPKGVVPVLIDGDFVLTESNAICRYLVRREGRKDLLPDDPKALASVESWMDWQASDLNGTWRDVFMGRVRKHPAFSDEARQASSETNWNAAMALLDVHLARSGPFVCGDTFTLADIVLALSANRWMLTPMNRPALGAIANWMQRMSPRAGFSDYCQNGIP